MKVIFRKSNGRLLGAQALGEDGVDKRISALAVALQMGATIYDLEEAELCYAPQFGSAKDPINFAGMVAADVLRGDMPLSHWDSAEKGFLLDVREPVELAVEHAPGAVNIPLSQLRARLGELPRDREILIICRSGQRAYYATRVLLQRGFKARNLSGGMLSRTHAETLWASWFNGELHTERVFEVSWPGYSNNLAAPAEKVQFFNIDTLNGKVDACSTPLTASCPSVGATPQLQP